MGLNLGDFRIYKALLSLVQIAYSICCSSVVNYLDKEQAEHNFGDLAETGGFSLT